MIRDTIRCVKTLFLGLLALALFSPLGFAQSTRVQPDCIINFGIGGGAPLTGAGQATVPQLGGGQNTQFGCFDWRINYFVDGFSGVSLLVQAAPDNAGAPGTWATFSGSTCASPPTYPCLTDGVNPNTSTTYASTGLSGPAPWVRVILSSATGSGSVSGVLYGCRRPGCSSLSSSTSGGGGSCSGNIVCNNQANTFTLAGSLDLSAAIAAGDLVLPTDPSYTNGDCAELVSAAGKFHIGDTGSPCGGGGGGSFVKISQQTLSAPAASVTFSSIPGTYTSLYLTMVTRSTYTGGTSSFMLVSLNGDNANDYWNDSFFVQNSQSNPSSGGPGQGFVGNFTCANSVANFPTSMSITFLNYAGTTFYKTFQSLWYTSNATSLSGDRQSGQNSVVWDSTSAITSITVFDGNSANLVTGSVFTLYGLM
jgi:hypothetical protein